MGICVSPFLKNQSIVVKENWSLQGPYQNKYRKENTLSYMLVYHKKVSTSNIERMILEYTTCMSKGSYIYSSDDICVRIGVFDIYHIKEGFKTDYSMNGYKPLNEHKNYECFIMSENRPHESFLPVFHIDFLFRDMSMYLNKPYLPCIHLNKLVIYVKNYNGSCDKFELL